MFKKMVIVDHAFSLQRHITRHSARDLVDELEQTMAAAAGPSGSRGKVCSVGDLDVNWPEVDAGDKFDQMGFARLAD